MKHNLIFAFAAVVFAVLVVGCGSPGSGEINRMLDETGFENAPTLGDLHKQMMIAEFDADYATIWDMYSKKKIEAEEKIYKDAKEKKFDEEIEKVKKQLAEEEKKDPKNTYMIGAYKRQIRDLEEDKAMVAAAADAKEYFIARRLKDREITYKITSEEMSDDKKTGWIMWKDTTDPDAKAAKRQRFVEEDGVWKFDGTGEE